uniref:Uncharacterized protein n=1 Tax=Onchocerca volvulus TaxID=6282 RepID=A0A8R1TLQ4_ONCVO
MPEEASVSQNEQQREQIMRKNVRRNTMQFEMYIKAMDTNLYQRNGVRENGSENRSNIKLYNDPN